MSRLQIKHPHLIVVLPFVWMTSSFLVIVVIMALLISMQKYPNGDQIRYSVFSAKPLVLGATTSRVYSDDAKVEKLNAVLTRYKCPMAGLGNVFVEEANRNDIPFWLVAAISFQESSCGKNTPDHPDVEETYNAWGWGVWGANVKQFDSWEHGIRVVSKYMGDKFYSKGVSDTCQIMEIYTPPSNGSWCEGVKFFGDMIENYKTPSTD